MLTGSALEKELISVYRDVLVAAIWSGKDIESATVMAKYALEVHPGVLRIVETMTEKTGA